MDNRTFYLMLICLIILCGLACNQDSQDNQYKTSKSEHSTTKIFQKVASSASNIDFENKIIDYSDAHINKFDYYYNGGGVAIGDINNDGLPDIYFAGNLISNKLYLNKGDFVFEDISEKAGVSDDESWSNGVSMLDINLDGWLDIFVCHGGIESKYSNKRQNHLYINNQDGTFSEKAKEYGLVDNSYSSQIAQIDFDLDGDLDIFLMNHVDFKNRFRSQLKAYDRAKAIVEFRKEPKMAETFSNMLYVNNGNQQFSRTSVNLPENRWGYGLGIAISDLNKDSKPDIYIANDYQIPDYVYYNQGNGKFKEVNKEVIGHTPLFSMGCDVADLNNDTWPDIVNVDMVASDRVRNKTLMRSMDVNKFYYYVEQLDYQKQYMYNVMQVNNGNGTFSDIGQLSGTTQTDWSWIALLADFDLDSDKDYFISNGFRKDTKNRDIQQTYKMI